MVLSPVMVPQIQMTGMNQRAARLLVTAVTIIQGFCPLFRIAPLIEIMWMCERAMETPEQRKFIIIPGAIPNKVEFMYSIR